MKLTLTPSALQESISRDAANGKTLKVRHRLGQEFVAADRRLTDGDNTYSIGQPVILQLVVTVNEAPADVLSSTWVVQGSQVELQTVQQTPDLGTGTINPGPVTLQGGLNDDPALTVTAWAAPGEFAISITGIASCEGEEVPFTTEYTITILAPTISTPELRGPGSLALVINAPQIGAPAVNGQVLELTGYTMPGTNTQVGFYWSFDLDGNEGQVGQLAGMIGFLQFVGGQTTRTSSPMNNQPARNQALGLPGVWFLDDNKDPNELWYGSPEDIGMPIPVTMDDSPSVDLDQQDNNFPGYQFVEYSVNDLFVTYIAYQATPNAVLLCMQYVTWNWAAGATLQNNNVWELNAGAVANLGPVQPLANWLLPNWQGNLATSTLNNTWIWV